MACRDTVVVQRSTTSFRSSFGSSSSAGPGLQAYKIRIYEVCQPRCREVNPKPRARLGGMRQHALVSAQAVERLYPRLALAFDIEGCAATRCRSSSHGLLKEPAEFFSSETERSGPKAIATVGLGESGGKIVRAIEARRRIPLDRFILALSIPHVGESTAKLLARNFHTLTAFMKAMRSKDAAEELDSIEGIGDVMAKAITDFFAEDHTIEALDRLIRIE